MASRYYWWVKASFPDLSAPDWTPRLAALLEAAALAIGRLDARVSVTPVRSVWSERASWTGFAQARRGQGAELEEVDIFGLVCGIAVPNRQPIAFAGDELTTLRSWQSALTTSDARHWREMIPVTLDLPADWGDRPALLRALELTARTARGTRDTAPWLDMPALLKALGVTRTPLPCLVAADKALRFAPRYDEAIVPRHLKALTKSALEGIERLDAIESDRVRAALALNAALRPGKMVALAALLQRRPMLTPLRVSRVLRLTISGAGKLLARAAYQGLVVEISGRQAWRAYLTPELAIKFGFVARSVGRPPILAEPDTQALAHFDSEIAEIDALLGTLGVAVGGRNHDNLRLSDEWQADVGTALKPSVC